MMNISVRNWTLNQNDTRRKKIANALKLKERLRSMLRFAVSCEGCRCAE